MEKKDLQTRSQIFNRRHERIEQIQMPHVYVQRHYLEAIMSCLGFSNLKCPYFLTGLF
jgi:hypothetical protein